MRVAQWPWSLFVLLRTFYRRIDATLYILPFKSCVLAVSVLCGKDRNPTSIQCLAYYLTGLKNAQPLFVQH